MKGNFTDLRRWTDVIDLNYTAAELRNEILQAMKHWVKKISICGFHCDMARTVPLGLRVEGSDECDAVHLLFWLTGCERPEYHGSV